MSRLLVPLFILGYLAVLTYGLFCHALYFRTDKHPGMYFIVWDMYCGWSAYETRQHMIGEGESGTYYQLTPPPWGSVQVYGKHDRQTHDYYGTFVVDMARNTLAHTSHEPMTRLFLVEEVWPRKYNLPDHLWTRRYREPKDPQSYFQVRRVTTAGGQILQDQPAWLTRVSHECLMDNPRLRRDMSAGRQFYAISPDAQQQQMVTPASYELPVE